MRAAATIEEQMKEITELRSRLTETKDELAKLEVELKLALEQGGMGSMDVPAGKVIAVLQRIIADLLDAEFDVKTYMSSLASGTSSTSSNTSTTSRLDA